MIMEPGTEAKTKTRARAKTETRYRRPNAEDWKKIRQASVFSSLEDGDFRLLAGTPPCESYDKGQTLFFQNDPASAFFVVLEGWLLLLRDKSDGTRTIIKLVGPGQSFAEVLITEGALYPVSAEAASFVRVARFDAEKFRALIAVTPHLGLSMIAATFRQMSRMFDQIEHLKSWSIERRVAEVLLQICGSSSQESRCFTLPIEQTLIAARLAITPSTLSRVLKKMGPLGVEARYGRITINDVRRLSDFVTGDDEEE